MRIPWALLLCTCALLIPSLGNAEGALQIPNPANTLETKDFLEIIEVDPLPPEIIVWAPENHRQLFSFDGKQVFFYLIGQLKPGYRLLQGGKPLAIASDNTFKLKIDVPLEPHSFVWDIAGPPKSAVLQYRLTTVWKNIPAGMRVWILDQGKLSKLSAGFTGTVKEIGYTQLYRKGTATRFLQQKQLDDELFFRIFPPPILTRPTAWRLEIESTGNGLKRSMDGRGEPPQSIPWSDVVKSPEGTLETPGVYTYKVLLFYEGMAYTGLPNKFAILKRRGRYFSGSLGVTRLSYVETGVPEYLATVFTFKAGYARPLFLSAHIDLAINAFGTLFTLSNNQPGVDAHFLGANLRLGYSPPFIRSPWSVTLSTGVYYLTTFVTQNAFGFKNLVMMQFTPSLRFNINHTNTIALYLKTAPVALGAFTLDFSQRELATGIYYERWLPNDHPLFFAIDYSNLQVSLPPIQLTSTTLSFSAGYWF